MRCLQRRGLLINDMAMNSRWGSTRGCPGQTGRRRQVCVLICVHDVHPEDGKCKNNCCFLVFNNGGNRILCSVGALPPGYAGSHPTQEAVTIMVTVLSTSCSCMRPASFLKSMSCGYLRKGDSSLCIAVVCYEGDHITGGQVWRTARMGEMEKNLQSVAGRHREKRLLADQMG
jgi:hypothetical protein